MSSPSSPSLYALCVDFTQRLLHASCFERSGPRLPPTIRVYCHAFWQCFHLTDYLNGLSSCSTLIFFCLLKIHAVPSWYYEMISGDSSYHLLIHNLTRWTLDFHLCSLIFFILFFHLLSSLKNILLNFSNFTTTIIIFMNYGLISYQSHRPHVRPRS